MSIANYFELLCLDGEARTGILTTPHGAVRTPAFMPVGTQGAMKGLHWREMRDAGDRHRARQHLSSDAAARRRADRRTRRLAEIHHLGRADADGFRRLPGDVAGAVTQGQGTWRDLSFAYRRRRDRADAGTRDRGPAAARLRHCDAARRMRASAGGARRYRARHAALAALGRAQQARPSRGRPPAICCSASFRAATVPSCGTRARAG